MKSYRIILLIFVAVGTISCKENNTKPNQESIEGNKEVKKAKFSTEYDSCAETKYLYDAIPHVDKIENYTFESVGCSGNSIVARYDHPTQNYEFQTIIYHEVAENKPMYNLSMASFEMTSVMKANGTDISDLKIFDNEVINIKKSTEYFEVSYMATYRKNYTIIITIKGKDLSSKGIVEPFLNDYLKAFKKQSLV